MPDQMFKTELKLSDPFVAEGFLEKDYDAVAMYVGVVQLNDDETEIEGAAYGTGASDAKDVLRLPSGLKSWTMQMKHDAEKKLVVGKKATGFIIVELPGGKVTGWLAKNIDIIAP